MGGIDPKTEAELEQVLETVLRRAYENDVITVHGGGIELRNELPEIPDWELMIYQLQPLPSQ